MSVTVGDVYGNSLAPSIVGFLDRGAKLLPTFRKFVDIYRMICSKKADASFVDLHSDIHVLYEKKPLEFSNAYEHHQMLVELFDERLFRAGDFLKDFYVDMIKLDAMIDDWRRADYKTYDDVIFALKTRFQRLELMVESGYDDDEALILDASDDSHTRVFLAMFVVFEVDCQNRTFFRLPPRQPSSSPSSSSSSGLLPQPVTVVSPTQNGNVQGDEEKKEASTTTQSEEQWLKELASAMINAFLFFPDVENTRCCVAGAIHRYTSTHHTSTIPLTTRAYSMIMRVRVHICTTIAKLKPDKNKAEICEQLVRLNQCFGPSTLPNPPFKNKDDGWLADKIAALVVEPVHQKQQQPSSLGSGNGKV